MAHEIQRQYCLDIRSKHPDYFVDKKVLDFGSLDINGNNRELFSGGEYIGVDIGPGSNVDVVCLAHEYKTDVPFDTIISTQMLEHDQYWQRSLTNMLILLKSGGLLLLHCATNNFYVHGTKTSTPGDSPHTSKIDGWCDYYKNITEADIRSILNPELNFTEYDFRIFHDDLGFYGIKF